ncbi:MAG TPA: sigma-54-dependent Fis family transcriptional regulator [Nitrospirae bacterium]|nr:sigma-54-dependent Fis family transcriptional regulator [Nitrospirota bacterium]
MNKILVVDDQKGVRYSFKKILGEAGYEVATASSGEEAIELTAKSEPDLIFMDVKMPGMDGLETLKRLKEMNPKLLVIMMTAYSTTEKAITAMELGAYDYLTKPFDNRRLTEIIKKALEVRKKMFCPVAVDETEYEMEHERIVGSSSAMLEIFKKIGQIAGSDMTALLRGESGTGKELIARAIYNHSPRADKYFLVVNCAAIPDTLLESELFGHERGAFTGADTKRIGRFEQCHGGTLFLDEIGDMPLALQAKILRVLQDGSFTRLGSTEPLKCNVRIIAATNKSLEEMLKQGKFREDLYYRLNVISLHIPPLRERREDIKDLAQHFLSVFNKELNKDKKGISADTLKIFEEYHWPGNVRELENVMHRAMVLCQKDYISHECCTGLPVAEGMGKPAAVMENYLLEAINSIFSYSGGSIYQDFLSTAEMLLIKKAIEITHGNQVQAAKLLGISRNTLRRKLEGDGSNNKK